jgi:SRSO17 transposase
MEQSFALAKGEVGLEEDAVRRWDGWYRHLTLALCALAYLAVLRAQLRAPQETLPAPRPPRTSAQKAQVAKGGPSSSRSS